MDMKKRIFSFILALALVLGVLPLSVFAEQSEQDISAQADTGVTVTNGDYSLTLNKTHFEVGEDIVASVKAPNPSVDWIGIYSVDGISSILWDYVSTQGTDKDFNIKDMTRKGEHWSDRYDLPEGRYFVRLIKNGSSDFANIACAIPIIIGSPDVVEGDGSLMSIEKTEFLVGEPIMVSAIGAGTDWVGLYYPGSRTSAEYFYVSEAKGGPGSGVAKDVRNGREYGVGDYLVRLMPNDSTISTSGNPNASAYVLISIVESYDDVSTADKLVIDASGDTEEPDPEEPDIGDDTAIDYDELEQSGMTGDTSKISLEKLTFKKGEPILVTAYGNSTDWVGIYASLEQQTATKWHYISAVGSGQAYDVTQGTALEAGEYYIRFVPNNENIGSTTAIAKITVTDEEYVSPDEPEEPDTPEEKVPYITTDKSTYSLGESIIVTAGGCEDSKAWVGIYPVNSSAYLYWHYVANSQGGPGDGVPREVKNIPEGNYYVALIPNYSGNISTAVARVEITISGSVEGPVSATYDRTGKDGSATGVVTVTVGQTTNRDVVMFWGDENGKLEGYAPHAKFKANATSVSYTFTDSVFIPSGATRLLVYLQNSTSGLLSEEFISIDLGKGADIDISGVANSKLFIISDIHIGRNDGVVSATNFKKMLNEAIALNPSGIPICIVGDIADGAQRSQYDEMVTLYNEVLSANGKMASDYPMYITIGNHDYSASGSLFFDYMILVPNGEKPTDTSYDFWLDGYHHIFLGSDSGSGLYATLSEDTLAWLDERLAENRDEERPVFVYLHQSIYNTVAGSLPGEGWNGVNNEEALIAVLKKYPEVLLFNGHSHWEMNSRSNIFEGTEELPIHAFNCASVSYLWTGYNSTSGSNLEGSQGYMVEIYADKVLVRGRDFINSEWLPSAQYCIEFAGDCEHDYDEIAIQYANGFDKAGKITLKCSSCSKEKSEECEKMLTSIGYSVRNDDGNGFGLSGGYMINQSLRTLYEALNAVTLDFGIIVLNPEHVVADSFMINGLISSTERALQISISETSISTVNVMIRGIDEDTVDLDLIISAYIVEKKNGGIIDTSFYQADTSSMVESFVKTDATLYSVSYNSVAEKSIQ